MLMNAAARVNWADPFGYCNKAVPNQVDIGHCRIARNGMATLSFTRKPTNDLVSVVISTYCGERLIGETLASLGRQTYTNWELIVVEDGSHDGTEQIVRDFARKHRWNRVDFSRSEQNHGLGHTRNLTFAKARGEYIAILDADDRWLPEYLAISMQAFKESGKDIAYSSTVMIEDKSELLLGVWGPYPSDLADFPQSLLGRNFITPSATIIRRQVLADVGPWDTFRFGEDFSYWLRCVAAGMRFKHVGGCHCLYRKNHDGALTQSLCSMIEGVANVSRAYMRTPGMRRKTSRKYVSNSYALAARYHATADPRRDPSADRSRAPSLYRKAWRFRKKRISYLWQAAKIGISEIFRRHKRPIQDPTPIEDPAVKRAA